MVRASSSKKAEREERSQGNAEAEERKRLQSLALSKKLLSLTPPKPISPLHPSNTILKHHGRDILKKGQRKNRFLFSFPALLAPISGGKIGELKDLGTKNPILYIDFPQGRMKLFGTIVYPKNKYLTLQFARGAKNVICEDCFENMVVFSDAWWIGRKDENPEEVKLEFPKQLDEGEHSNYDFKGGAGKTSEEKSTINKTRKGPVESLSPEIELADDESGDSGLLTDKIGNDAMEVTPTRQSSRTAGKAFNYAERSSSGDGSIGSDAEMPEMKEVGVDEDEGPSIGSLPDKNIESRVEASSPPTSENMDVELKAHLHIKNPESSLSVENSKGASTKRGAFIQATISTLFEKVEAKKSMTSVKGSLKPKGSPRKRQLINPKQKAYQLKVGEASNKGPVIKRRKPGRKTVAKQKHTQVDNNDIEEISSESQDANGSDEDWAA